MKYAGLASLWFAFLAWVTEMVLSNISSLNGLYMLLGLWALGMWFITTILLFPTYRSEMLFGRLLFLGILSTVAMLAVSDPARYDVCYWLLGIAAMFGAGAFIESFLRRHKEEPPSVKDPLLGDGTWGNHVR
jgi:hypothetical protein